MKSIEVERDELVERIKKTNGKIFNVTFIKRTDNSRRRMNARLGVKSYLKGGQIPYNPIDKQLIPVFDMTKKGYRSISTENIISATILGEQYTVKQ